MSPRHFLSIADLTRDELDVLVEATRRNVHAPLRPALAGRSVALLFFAPSVRTRASTEAAVAAMGGHPTVLEPERGAWGLEWREAVRMDGEAAEHIKDAVGALSSYVAAIGVRCFASGDWTVDREDPVINAFARHSRVPVINLESALAHPLQSLADLAALRNRFGRIEGRRLTLAWCTHPKALPMAVPLSTVTAAARAGMEVTVACPEGFDLPEEAFPDDVRFRTVRGLEEGIDGTDVVYAKAWGGLGGNDADRRAAHADWKITAERMDRSPGAVFMHCLPLRRNVVADDAVVDAPRSIVQRQAAMRLPAARAVLERYATPEGGA